MEAEVVRRICRMCVNDGLGARVIGRRLMADGVPAANQAKRWWNGQVYRTLSNETYKGTGWYGKARFVSTEDWDTGPRKGQGHVDTGAVP